MADYEAAIFFDNEERYLEDVGRFCDIQGVFVGATPNFNSNKVVSLPLVYEEEFGVPGSKVNPYYDRVVARQKGDVYDEMSGFKEEHAVLLDQWIDSTQGKRRVAIFDWDRTITKIEGYWFPQEKQTIDIFAKYFAAGATATHINQYLCGGIQRYTFIKEVMQKCKENGIDILILTNNGMCVYSPSFKELVQDLCGDAPFFILCSRTWRGNKGLALKDTYPSLCKKTGVSGGSKTRRNKRRHRKTRRFRI